nr:YdeI family protein [Thermoactinomyces sp. CICC 24226]
MIANARQWKEEFEKLREIVLDCGLTEDFKWRHPCYTYEGKNVVLIHGFKSYCALLFHKGALLKDPHGLLVRQSEHTQSTRQIRFTQVQEIMDKKPILKEYIKEAIRVEKAGLKVDFKKTDEYTVPKELQEKFHEMPALKTAFEALTPGRQRAYLLYFSRARQSKTRKLGIETYVQHIPDGKGMNGQCDSKKAKKPPQHENGFLGYGRHPDCLTA